MTKPEESVVVLAKHDEHFILINQFRKPINDYTIQLPGGGVNPNEDIKEAAKREFLEETGYQCGTVDHLGLRPASWISDEITHVFYTNEVLKYVGQALEEHEKIEVRRVKVDEIYSLIEEGTIDDSELCFAILQGILKGYLTV
ncbi:NUDIX hydrolase [Piscibacillus halophilus]|uniref:ADP-ribose pyrophosphatase n=1 Tax=Piscibacillus halophilus TaxID=571933 RepID=A0A1H9ILM4_9BACI|nr:NUDIX hydrolase [Piscibacillus halophilus]SEQ75419.1 ADP-ribose pyrophosphatase [Piscibacillus halophilus]